MWELLRGTPKGQKTCPKSLQLTFTKVAITTAMKLRLLLLGRKSMIKVDSVLKNRDITSQWI